MYIDPEKAYKEKLLIEEISRLESLIYGDNREKNDLEFTGKAIDSIEAIKSELNILWEQIRKEHYIGQKKTNNLLTGILVSLILILTFLAFKS